jgi:hypothetical protein
MPILTQDIKLLKSAVMADTTDGGGQMTGVEVIDGQSNNLFPDTSAMDRAFGRVQTRKLFGVAHTSDTATLMGAHAIITDAPDDPLVHCTLIKTPGWADTRTTARDAVEKYLVKGPKAGVRIYDTHYSGSLQLRLITFVGGVFPAGGDAIVLHNPDGGEQYVRVLKVTVVNQTVALIEGGNTVTQAAQVATCELGSALSMDVLGPPAARTYPNSGAGVLAESAYATLYTTNIAGGAKFYGVKPLEAVGVPGDYSVMTTGGIYTPVVPAATIESPIIDQYPYLDRSSVVPTGYSSVTLPAVTMAVTANTTLTAPTPIAPRSVAMTAAGGVAFTDNGAGVLLQGATEVGTVDYALGKITLSGSAPSYGTGAVTLAYKPGSSAPTSTHSAAFVITLANQGLAYVNAFEPPPAPGTFTLDYMAQGRWYTLRDNGDGKLTGGDSGYGVGSLNYSTGSMSVTLGAIPDVGSQLIASWGNAGSATSVPVGSLPTRLSTQLALSAPISPSGAVITWARGGTNYSATCAASGLLTGDASGSAYGSSISFAPGVFPSGDITVTASRITAPAAQTSFIDNGGGAYTLLSAPLNSGSVACTLQVSYPSNSISGVSTHYLSVRDRNGILYARAPAYGGSVDIAVGTVNYTTGAITMGTTVSWEMWLLTYVPPAGTWNNQGYYSKTLGNGTVTLEGFTNFGYTTGSTAVSTTVDTFNPTVWTAWAPGWGANTLIDSAVFAMGGELYTVASGTLRKGWSVATGVATTAGSASSGGQLSVTSLPANGTNTLVWYNLAQNVAAPMIWSGVFRTASAPLKSGVFQLRVGADVGSANDAGVISGGNFGGTVDVSRGIVTWNRTSNVYQVPAQTLSYNAVFLQYLPLDSALLGLDTARLPLDGKVPIYRTGDLVVVHNTLSTALPNPLTKGTAYSLGRERIASVRVKDALGVVVPDTLYTALLDPGTLTVPVGSVITGYTQPLTVEHRIEDMLLCSSADISGQLKFTRSLTHNFPADTSFVSSAMPFGDLFARVYGMMEQATWTSVWSDTLIGSVIIPQFNDAQYPIAVTNAGAIKERWALIFTNTTSFRVIGESVGEIGTGNTANPCAPNNPATGVPYFTLPALGWGAGWAAGNVLRFNTDACGTPFWAVRTVLQGPASIDSDQFTLAFRGDVDRP